MNVYYNKTWGIVITAMSSVVLLLHVYLYLISGKWLMLNVLSSLLIIAAGILYLTRPYFYFSNTEIKLFAPLGHTVRHYVFESIRQLELEGNKLYYLKNGKRKRIRITRWMCNQQDYNKFVSLIKGEDTSLLNELHN